MVLVVGTTVLPETKAANCQQSEEAEEDATELNMDQSVGSLGKLTIGRRETKVRVRVKVKVKRVLGDEEVVAVRRRHPLAWSINRRLWSVWSLA